MRLMRKELILSILAAIMSTTAIAGGADVVDVKAVKASDGTWRFDVTVGHDDAGWNHYANSWQVLAPDGKVLATRVLAHPHVDEQPFTRSKGGVEIPDGVAAVTIRAGDNVHGFTGKEMTVDLD